MELELTRAGSGDLIGESAQLPTLRHRKTRSQILRRISRNVSEIERCRSVMSIMKRKMGFRETANQLAIFAHGYVGLSPVAVSPGLVFERGSCKEKYMTMSNTDYTIVRPPLVRTCELPPPERLLEVEPGDMVKLCFCETGQQGERMWVEVIECCHPRCWRGTLQNSPDCIECLQIEDDITFHPLDVIDIRKFAAKALWVNRPSNTRPLHQYGNFVTDLD